MFDVQQIQAIIGKYICDHCDVTWRVTAQEVNGNSSHCWVCGRFGRRKTS